MELLALDLSKVFEIEIPVAELVLRGSVLYVGLLFLLRVLPRRTGGELEIMDLIFVILIAEAATHAFGEYKSITEAFIMIGTLMGWNYLVNRLSYRFPFIDRLVAAPALQIVKDGKLLRRNMRREFITEDELYEQFRKAGVEQLSQVKHAYVESDGTISVIRKEEQ